MSILDYIEKIKRENEGPRITAQEPRIGLKPGGIVEPGVKYYGKNDINISGLKFGEKQKIWSPQTLQKILSKSGKSDYPKAYKIILQSLKDAGIKYNPSKKEGVPAQFTNVTDATIKKFDKVATKLKAEAGLPMSRFQTAEIKKDIKTFVKNKVAKGEYVSRPIILEEFGLDKGGKGWALINRALGKKVGPDTYEGGLLNKLGQEEKITQAIKIGRIQAEKKLTEADDVLKAINDEFKFNPDVSSSEDVARSIYGDEFPKGDMKKMSKANLLKAEELVRQTDNDIITYLKVLEGSRVKPEGMKLPSQNIINDISDNILTGIEDPSAPGQAFKKKGFRFSPGILREYKLSIIDSLLGAKAGTYREGRKKFVTKGKELDEIFSLSATAKTAPGYAEAIQSISKTANQAKKKQIDLPFQRILNALDEGKTTMQWKDEKVSIADAAKDFNKTSLKFANKYKVRSPKINVGGNFNNKLFENYGKLSKKNIADTFKNKNYYLTEVKNRPVGTITVGLSKKLPGSKLKALGLGTGIVLGSTGGVYAAETGVVDKVKSWPVEHPWLTGGATVGATAATKAGRKVLGKIVGGAFGPTGIALTYPALGMLGEDFKTDLSKPLDRAILSGEAALSPTLVKGTEAMTKGIKNPLIRKGMERALNLGMSLPMATKVARIASPIGLLSLAGEGIYRAGKKEMERRAQMSAEELDAYMLENQSRGWSRMAGGGMVGIRKPNAIAPTGGPQSGGLPSLYNNGRKL